MRKNTQRWQETTYSSYNTWIDLGHANMRRTLLNVVLVFAPGATTKYLIAKTKNKLCKKAGPGFSFFADTLSRQLWICFQQFNHIIYFVLFYSILFKLYSYNESTKPQLNKLNWFICKNVTGNSLQSPSFLWYRQNL